MTKESCSKTTFEFDLYRDLNDSCSSTASTLDTFEPTTSPVQSEDRSMKATLKGSTNTTFVQAHIAHVQIGHTKEQQQNSPNMMFDVDQGLDGDRKSVREGFHGHITYDGMPVVENRDQARWIKNGTSKDKNWLKSQEAEEKCISCEVHFATINHLESKRKKDKEKKQERTQRYENLQKQYDDSRKECDNLRKHNNDIHEMANLHKNMLSDCKEKSYREKEELLVKITAQLTKYDVQSGRIVDLEAKNKILEENLHHETQEKTAMQLKINSLEAETKTIDELKQQFKNLEENQRRERQEEKKTMMEKIKDLEAQAERIPELEQKRNDSEESTMAMQEKVNDLMDENEELTHEKSSLEKEVGQLNNALESSKRKNTNQRRIHNDMTNKIDELEEQDERQKAQLAIVGAQLTTVGARLNAVTTQSNNLRIYVNELLRMANAFYTRYQAREEEHDELRQIINGLRRYHQVLREPIDITVLFVQDVSHTSEVHVPD